MSWLIAILILQIWVWHVYFYSLAQADKGLIGNSNVNRLWMARYTSEIESEYFHSNIKKISLKDILIFFLPFY